MANIEWHKVTWYSKLIAMVIFIVFPFIGFYYGIGYGEALQQANQASQTGAAQSSTPTNTGTEYYSNTAEWQVGDFSSGSGSFSIAYPIDFNITSGNGSLTPSWLQNSPESDKGVLYLALAVPKAFEPQTNFDDAQLTVGSSRDDSAVVGQCLVADPAGGPPSATSTATINGIPFTVFKSSDAGAGNYYETTSYRVLHAGQCYAVEYTIHSSQIGNYPPEYNLKPFDKNQITSVLDRIVGTFKFIK